ncbi:MAG: diacylglycerol kinase family lipid kinase, partial [Caulobacteraceae bacterium]
RTLSRTLLSPPTAPVRKSRIRAASWSAATRARRLSGGAKKRSVIAVINPAAGRAGPKAMGEMQALFEEMNQPAEVFAPDPSDLEKVIGEALDAKPDLLVVLAGDGTARAVAELSGPNGPLIAPLPGGTMNMLPKALYGENDWKHALRETLQNGCERAVGGGEVGGHTFYCAAMIGATALFAPAREAVRSRKLGEAMTRARDAYRRAFAGRVRFETDGGHYHKAQSLTLLCPLIS